jgi:hypothetical protein
MDIKIILKLFKKIGNDSYGLDSSGTVSTSEILLID